MKRLIIVANNNKDEMFGAVVADVRGPLAIHRELVEGGVKAHWTITHVATGYCITTVGVRSKAVAMVRRSLAHPDAAAWGTITIEACAAWAKEHADLIQTVRPGLPCYSREDHDPEIRAYREASDNYLGWCDTCCDYTAEQVEPDIRRDHGRRCPICGSLVVGADVHLFAIAQ